MDGRLTIRGLQQYIRSKDHAPERRDDYFLKLAEEVGELAKAMREGAPAATPAHLKGTVEEELWDVIYYVLVLANCYDIDLETWIPLKEALSNEKHRNAIAFPAQ